MPAGTVYHKPAAPYYVQRRDGRNLETVDEFDTRKKTLAMLAEYRISDRSAVFYLSRRPCAGWNDAPAPVGFQSVNRNRAPLDLSPRLSDK
jgi:hypothetical protein